MYHIVASHSGKAVTAANAGTADGTNIHQLTKTNGYQWQRWKIISLGNSEYKLQDMNSGKYLGVVSDSAATNANVVLQSESNGTGQVFKLVNNTNSTISILSKSSSYQCVLTVENGSMTDGSNIMQATYQDTEYQRFMVTESVVTMDQMLPLLSELYAYTVEITTDTNERQMLVLQYIRRNTPYIDWTWSKVAGEINASYVSLVDSKNPMMSLIFSGVILSNPEAATNSFGSYLMDGSGEYIDFYHMCATINGLLYNTPDGLSILYSEAEVDDLSGWAGDLQTFLRDNILPQVTVTSNTTENYNQVYQKFSELMGTGSFSMYDLRADVDAVNINALIASKGLLGAFADYYASGYETRYTTFVNGCSRDTFYTNVRWYAQTEDKYWILLAGISVTAEQCNAAADAFVDFIWEAIENEQ